METKIKRIQITLYEKNLQDLSEVQRELGFNSRAQTFRFILDDWLRMKGYGESATSYVPENGKS